MRIVNGECAIESHREKRDPNMDNGLLVFFLGASLCATVM